MEWWHFNPAAAPFSPIQDSHSEETEANETCAVYSLNRYSMPVTRTRNPNFAEFGDLDATKTTRFLFGDDDTSESKLTVGSTPDDNFPTLMVCWCLLSRPLVLIPFAAQIYSPIKGECDGRCRRFSALSSCLVVLSSPCSRKKCPLCLPRRYLPPNLHFPEYPVDETRTLRRVFCVDIL